VPFLAHAVYVKCRPNLVNSLIFCGSVIIVSGLLIFAVACRYFSLFFSLIFGYSQAINNYSDDEA